MSLYIESLKELLEKTHCGVHPPQATLGVKNSDNYIRRRIFNI